MPFQSCALIRVFPQDVKPGFKDKGIGRSRMNGADGVRCCAIHSHRARMDGVSGAELSLIDSHISESRCGAPVGAGVIS